jgi:type II secretory ATPase GspE/PulE/Tfp pilus assembly ATPase PilB-like protein
MLRQDPQIIVVGEIRDTATAQTAIQAGLTGHLVLTTIHSGAAAGVFTRLLDMGLEPYLVASAAVASLAQRLVRKVCPACRAPYSPHDSLVARFELNRGPIAFSRGAGCPACNGLGYSGRVAIGELLTVDEPIAELILSRARTRHIHAAARDAGMISLVHDGLARVRSGETTLEELQLAVAPAEEAV